MRKILLIVLAFMLIIIGGLILKNQYSKNTPDGLIFASGRIEGREITIASKIQGRIKSLLVDEGDSVKEGQLLAEISSDQLEARYQSVKESASVLKAQIEQISSDIAYTEKNSEENIDAAKSAVEAAKFQLEKAKAVYEGVKSDYERYKNLYEKGLISASNFDKIKMKYETSLADVKAAEKELNRARANYESALATKDLVEAKRKQLKSTEYNYLSALAKEKEVYADLQETKIYSPADGTILSRPVEIGEVVNPGTPIYVMVDMNKLYVKVYINEPDIGKIKLGNEAKIYVDAFPDKAFSGRITKVYNQAEFTPKNVETKEERVKLVFGVEVSIDNNEGVLKPGMPADVVIRWKEGAPWVKPTK